MKVLALFALFFAVCFAQREVDYVLRFYGQTAPGPSSNVMIATGKAGTQDFTTLIDSQDGFDLLWAQSLGPKAYFVSVVTFTSQTTFTEQGNITFATDQHFDHFLSFESIGQGLLNPINSALVHGVVGWNITGGLGAFTGASGIITSNFVLNSASGNYTDNHYGIIWLPQ